MSCLPPFDRCRSLLFGRGMTGMMSLLSDRARLVGWWRGLLRGERGTCSSREALPCAIHIESILCEISRPPPRCKLTLNFDHSRCTPSCHGEDSPSLVIYTSVHDGFSYGSCGYSNELQCAFFHVVQFGMYERDIVPHSINSICGLGEPSVT